MKKHIIILLVLVLNYSCESENVSQEPPTSNFYALTVGNSWEYKYYLRDVTSNNFVVTPVTEIVDITSTVDINNTTYYNFKHIVTGNDGTYNALPNNGEQNYKLRDSLGYLIDEIGLIRYNNSNYDEHFVDFNTDITQFSKYLQLSETIDNVSTNAGSFSCYDNHYYFKDINGNLLNAIDNVYREDGKGEILSTLSNMANIEHYAEKRLESFSIQ